MACLRYRRILKYFICQIIGRVYTVIVRGEPEAVVKAITDGKDSPQVVDVLPLTLEEIFIYEMGGEDYEVKDIIY